MLNDAELRLTAFMMSSCGTISDASVIRAGPSNAAAIPCTAASPYTSHRVTRPLIVSSASDSEVSSISDCVTSMTRRLGNRSATMPVHGDSSGTQMNWTVVMNPSANAELWVRMTSTSQSWAIRDTQVPMFDTSAPEKYLR